jgi:hypothetical protein
MDMLMSGMSGGMDMSSDGMFRTYNSKLARGYWYIIAGFVGFVVLCRGFEWYQNWDRLANITYLRFIDARDACGVVGRMACDLETVSVWLGKKGLTDLNKQITAKPDTFP